MVYTSPKVMHFQQALKTKKMANTPLQLIFPIHVVQQNLTHLV